MSFHVFSGWAIVAILGVKLTCSYLGGMERRCQMTKICFLIFVAICTFIPDISSAASLRNNDGQDHRIRGRSSIRPEWVYITLYHFSSQYFACQNGCEIEVIDTGSTIQLDSDAEIAIEGGQLRVRFYGGL